MTRLDELRTRLAARTTGEGQPKKGYTKNVAALQTEIRRLSAQTVTDTDAVATERVGPLDTQDEVRVA